MVTISEECREFLLQGTRTGKLATVRADGRPHVVPIWFDIDEDTLVFMTGQISVKLANIRRDPRVCLCVDDETPPFAYAQIEGTVEINEEPESAEMLRWATRIGGRYMGADQAEAFGKRNAVPGECLLRLIPTKVRLEKNIASW
jgi:PPOX class probable F420-dependent enzyme